MVDFVKSLAQIEAALADIDVKRGEAEAVMKAAQDLDNAATLKSLEADAIMAEVQRKQAAQNDLIAQANDLATKANAAIAEYDLKKASIAAWEEAAANVERLAAERANRFVTKEDELKAREAAVKEQEAKINAAKAALA